MVESALRSPVDIEGTSADESVDNVTVVACSADRWSTSLQMRSQPNPSGYKYAHVQLFVGPDDGSWLLTTDELIDATTLVQSDIIALANGSEPVEVSAIGPDGLPLRLRLVKFIPKQEYKSPLPAVAPQSLIKGLEWDTSYIVVGCSGVAGLLFLVVAIVCYRNRAREIIYNVSEAENEAWDGRPPVYVVNDVWASKGKYNVGDIEDDLNRTVPLWETSANKELVDPLNHTMLCDCELCNLEPKGSPRRSTVTKITLKRKSRQESFGFSLGSSAPMADGTVQHVITNVATGSIADGQIFRGDVIHTINGQNIRAMPHEIIAGLVVASEFQIELGLEDGVDAEIQTVATGGTQTTPPLEPRPPPLDPSLHYITLVRPVGGGFGFSLGSPVVEDGGSARHVVVQLQEGSPAYEYLGIGWTIRSINRVNVDDLEHKDVIKLIKASKHDIVLGIVPSEEEEEEEEEEEVLEEEEIEPPSPPANEELDELHRRFTLGGGFQGGGYHEDEYHADHTSPRNSTSSRLSSESGAGAYSPRSKQLEAVVKPEEVKFSGSKLKERLLARRKDAGYQADQFAQKAVSPNRSTMKERLKARALEKAGAPAAPPHAVPAPAKAPVGMDDVSLDVGLSEKYKTLWSALVR
jgi:hypothetical protein